MKQSPWWWESVPRSDGGGNVAAHPLPDDVDVLVVGAGYTGLSAALTLARAGRSVAVLEKEVAGYGASTRNGGMIGSGHRVAFSDVAHQYGEDVAEAVLGEGKLALEYTTGLIADEDIDCDFVRCGRFRGAWRPQDYETIARETEALRTKLGVNIDMVSKAEVHREVATEAYHGGCIYHEHGGLHPAKLHHGLLRVARDAGAAVYERTEVTRVRYDDTRYVVDTSRGTIRAGDIVMATNGYTTNAAPDMRRSLIPIASYMIATESLGRDVVDTLFPSKRMIVETRSRHCYYRPSPDGERILLGGRAALNHINTARSAPVLKQLLIGVLPQLKDVQISHSWLGTLGFTKDHLPRIGRDSDGIFYAMGYSGSGVAMAPYLGWRVANKVLGNSEGNTGFDPMNFPRVAFHPFIPLALPFVNMWYRWKDIVEGSKNP
jgi:glycine/D-amino acid oxidase-like deaminating enzyme